MENAGLFHGESRKIILGSPTLQTSSRRICIPITMPLTGESMAGLPDWLSDAYVAVAKTFTEVSPSVSQITDLTLSFLTQGDKGETLFDNPNARVRNAEIRKFTIKRAGSPEDPEVELHFKAYIPFGRKFWAWIGEMAGEEVHMAFPSSLGEVAPAEEPVQSGTLAFDPGAAAEGGEDVDQPVEDMAALELEPGPAPVHVAKEPTRTHAVPGKGGKSGPKDLEAEHAKQVSRPRGRPPKIHPPARTPADPLTVN